MKQVICMKWGTLYGCDYVNRLYSMVRRNTTDDLYFVCLTDDPTGIREEVHILPCPEVPLKGRPANSGWRKLTLWQPTLFDLKGEFLFLDLDVVVVDNIDELFTWGSDFCIMRNTTQPKLRIGNTSVFRFGVGSHPYLWEQFINDPESIPRMFPNEQMYVSQSIKQLSFWPQGWCALFKVDCIPRNVLKRWLVEPTYAHGTKVVAFPGMPNPPDAAAGRWPAAWYKKFYKHIRPAQWVNEHWR